MLHRGAVGLTAVLAAVLVAGAIGRAAPRSHSVQLIAGPPQNEFSFVPREMIVSLGRPVEITLVNNGRAEHDLVIEALGIKIQPLVAPKKSVTVTVTPTKTGSFEFFCTVPGHREAGMKGVITVK